MSTVFDGEFDFFNDIVPSLIVVWALANIGPKKLHFFFVLLKKVLRTPSLCRRRVMQVQISVFRFQQDRVKYV